ncbi:membrane protein [Gordonia phage Secretariat]|uniref:Membrane protein n=1 Tax=Gordonia phage Secretariat TaxID=2725616 RepID=A0A6M3SUL1_9CAUD|nr:membrane protein [Gordonia phage Secretariat]QJD49625.1 membrane protein [Gordonia phage Secretariat]
MSLSEIAKSVEKFAITNSPAILTATAVTGTVSVAVLTGKASFKAARLIAEAEAEKIQVAPDAIDVRGPLETREKVELVWTLYIPAVSVGATTIMAMIAANQIGTRRTAAMAAAYSVTEKAFGEYREKVVTKLGEKKEQGVRDEIAQDRVSANPPSSTQLVMVGDNEVLCYDQFSGRYFNSTMEKIKQGQNNINFRIINENYASLNDFYEEIGLDMLDVGDEFGWSTDRKLEVQISTVLSTDQRPCIAINYYTAPFKDYNVSYPH